MKDLEHKQISLLWDEVVIFPKLYSQTRDWLTNDRENKIMPFPYAEILQTLNKASKIVKEIKEVYYLIDICRFNLNEEFADNTVNQFSWLQGKIGVNDNLAIDNLKKDAYDIKEQVERHMLDTYVLKSFTELREVLNYKSFEEPTKKNLKALKYWLQEVNYNLIKLKAEQYLMKCSSEAIGKINTLIYIDSCTKNDVNQANIKIRLTVQAELNKTINTFKFELQKMNTISFDQLLITTAFCCMASDGHIDNREIALIKTLCDKSPLFIDFNFTDELNALVTKLNERGKEFISYYFDLLKNYLLTEQQELTLIDFAIRTINADEHIEYAEIKFFKVIRYNLKISDEKILAVYPDIEQFLEEDIKTESYLEKITNQYLDLAELPHFELISTFDTGSIKKTD